MNDKIEQSTQHLDLKKIKKWQDDFANARDWNRYHTPKNLAMALSVEASELVEIFQWLTPEESTSLDKDPKSMEAVGDELSDILFYTLRIANVLNLNVNEIFWRKMQKNADKYPVELAKGNAKKYTEHSKQIKET